METDYRRIAEEFARRGQSQVFAGWDRLQPDQRRELLADCSRVDFAWLEARLAEMRGSGDRTGECLEPAPVRRLSGGADAEALAMGEERLRLGRVAAFMVAGGQGSRLGFDGPKGCYPIGPVSGRSLFQWHAEQILARGRRYGQAIPWCVMTSDDNDAATRDFFRARACFGLDPDNVLFFRQKTVPTLGLDGKLLLSGPARLARNPDGHGGALAGLAESGILAELRRRGVEMLSYFQVDNPLVAIADPLFAGWHVKSGAEMSSKVLEKTGPEEKLGVVCLRNGRPAVVEYLDLDAENMRARDAGGRLRFWAGSIGVHMIDAAFAASRDFSLALPWHASRKRVPYFDGERLIRPERENACKFETFIFDALPLAGKTCNLEVVREEEFAPVKNAEGVDSAVSCRELMSGRFRRWLAAAGLETPDSQGWRLEISPLRSLDAGEFANKFRPGGLRPGDGLIVE